MYDNNKVVQIAINELGYLEKKTNAFLDDKTKNAGKNNYTKYGKDRGCNGQPWCDAFVDWCFIQAYGKEAAKKILGGFSNYTPTSASYLSGVPINEAKPGYIIFFKNSQRICHTGIIERIDTANKKIYTIEGNTSSKSGVVANGGCVARKSYSFSYDRIAKICKPNFGEVEKMYIDISHHHPVTNWDKVKANCPFLITKATEGTNFVDVTLKSFITECEKRKIPYWLYTFLRKGNEKAQAEFMVKTCKPLVGKYFVGYILDVERGNTASDVQKALDYIKTQSNKTMIYTGYADYSKYKSVLDKRGSNCAWWEARYGKNNGSYNASYPCHDGVELHQYSSNGKMAGVVGNIDINRLTGKRSESWFTGVASTLPTVKRGSKNEYVGILQGALLKNNFKTCIIDGKKKTLSIDNEFGAITETILKRWQAYKELEVDGICGKKTWASFGL